MKLSEQPEYLVAIPAAASKDFSTARKNLQILLSRARGEKDSQTTGYLLQALGDVEAEAGNVEIAHSLHEEALSRDSGNPLPLLLYAKGLLRAFRRPDLALKRVAEIESLMSSGRWTPGKDEPSREWYQAELTTLRQEIQSHKR